MRRLLIHNATVIDGNGTPAGGPKDIVIENNLITQVTPLDPVALQADAVIDATGKYVLPGPINNHAHLQVGYALACPSVKHPARGRRRRTRIGSSDARS